MVYSIVQATYAEILDVELGYCLAVLIMVVVWISWFRFEMAEAMFLRTRYEYS